MPNLSVADTIVLGGITGSARKGVLITPNDGADNVGDYRALWVGGAGAITGIFADDTVSVLISAVPAGVLLPFKFRRILATGTTATLMVALQ